MGENFLLLCSVTGSPVFDKEKTKLSEVLRKIIDYFFKLPAIRNKLKKRF
jgi:hypothetical protein